MDVKELLRQAADDLPVDHRIPPEVATRARRRRTRNGVLAGVVGVALLAGVGFGVRGAVGLFEPVAKETPAGPTEWRGIWPQATRAEAEAAQAAADEGDEGFTWQLQGEEVARRYAEDVLAFREAFVVDFPIGGPDDPGPLTAVVSDCDESVGVSVCKGARRAEVTIERLLRRDATGIWFVTGTSEPAGRTVTEAEVRVFVEEFLNFRYIGDDRVHDFLSDMAQNQYHTGEGGLHLFGPIAATFVEKIEPAEQDANLYEVTVVLSERPTEAVTQNVSEVLLVGPDSQSEHPSGLAVHAAARTDIPAGLEGQAIAFVQKFMEARMAGPDVAPGAESFLSPEGKAMFDGTDQHGNDLYLYGYPWDDPDFEWTGFAVLIENVERGGKQGSFVIPVNIERAWPTGNREPPASFTEILIVGPGQDLEGNDREFVVLSAEWVDV